MDFTLLAFYAFAALAVLSAGAVIGVRNPVNAALFLVLTFFTVACTWILAGAEFLGLAILVTLFRNRRTIDVAEIDTLKG